MENAYSCIQRVEYHAELLIPNLKMEHLYSAEYFLTRPGPLLTRSCPPNDQLGNTEIILQIPLRRAEIIFRYDRLMTKTQAEDFFNNYFQRLTNFLQTCCIEETPPLKVRVQGFVEIRGEIVYNHTIQELIDFFIVHPRRMDIVENFEQLSNFHYKVLARNRDSFEFLIILEGWRVSECHLSANGGRLSIKTNFVDVVRMLHDFFESLKHIKENLEVTMPK